MFTKIGTISVGVSNQDRALDFYVNTLGFEKVADQPMSATERWLAVAPPGAQTQLLPRAKGTFPPGSRIRLRSIPSLT